ncbi:hypothetical protein PV646_28810 [Streptomyces sp. ID05-26A]|nr:hypothetical protein [Streptomyces sp. ID05-26A]
MTVLPDVESLLVQWLAERHPNLTVVTDLDGLFTDATVPKVVQVNALPAQAAPPAWNGPTLRYEQDLDVDFYAASRVDALDLAVLVTSTAIELRNQLGQFGHVSQVIAPPATRRPDFNQYVRRYGAVWSLTTRPVRTT